MDQKQILIDTINHLVAAHNAADENETLQSMIQNVAEVAARDLSELDYPCFIQIGNGKLYFVDGEDAIDMQREESYDEEDYIEPDED